MYIKIGVKVCEKRGAMDAEMTTHLGYEKHDQIKELQRHIALLFAWDHA